MFGSVQAFRQKQRRDQVEARIIEPVDGRFGVIAVFEAQGALHRGLPGICAIR